MSPIELECVDQIGSQRCDAPGEAMAIHCNSSDSASRSDGISIRLHDRDAMLPDAVVCGASRVDQHRHHRDHVVPNLACVGTEIHVVRMGSSRDLAEQHARSMQYEYGIE